jgi:hypothetical protein
MSDAGEASLTIRPPQVLLERLCDPRVVVGFDIETHDWLDNSDGRVHIGELGWYTMKEESSLCFDRIIQIGRAISEADIQAPATKKALLIRPDGFVVAGHTTNFHGITHEWAAREGVALVDALQEIMTEVQNACAKGGRVVAHQIESAREGPQGWASVGGVTVARGAASTSGPGDVSSPLGLITQVSMRSSAAVAWTPCRKSGATSHAKAIVP